MTVLDHTTATCADGRALMAWLEARTRVVAPSDTVRRRLQRWRAGGQASFWLVEDVLHDLGLDVSEVPDHIWKIYDNGRRGCGRREAAA